MTADPPLTREAGQELPRRFYESALNAAERDDLDAALEVPGIDQEIAVLRLRLRTALRDRPGDLELLFKGVDRIVKLVAGRYRLPRQSQAELKLAFERVLAGISLDVPEGDAGDA